MVKIPDARSWSPGTLALVRRLAVRAVFDLKMTRKDVADMYGVSENTVGQWCAAFDEFGEDSFSVESAGRPVGSGRSLSPEQEEQVRKEITDSVPQDHEIALSGWTRAGVGELISKLFGIGMSDQGVGNYLRRWGMTPQKPARHAREADEEEVREFMEETLPETLKRVEEEDGEVHFSDETGMQVDDQIGRTYAPRGETPVLDVPKTRIAQNIISSVTPEGDLTWWIYSGTMNANRFIEWLKSLLETTTKKIFLFIDSHPAHTAKAVEQWVADHEDQLELIWLPRYSPEHNPDELLNNDVKQNLKNEPLPNDTSSFRTTLTNILEEIAEFPSRIKGYFHQSKIAPLFT